MNDLMRYTPTLPTFGNLRREFDRLFDDLLRDGNGTSAAALWAPRTDLSETEDRYVLRMDLPGLSKQDLTVELREGTLTVSGERKAEHAEQKAYVHRMERSYGRFVRSFTLPEAGAPDRVKARLRNGVLTVEVPKREAPRPRRIEVS